MFRCRFFTARYIQARYFNGDGEVAPPVVVTPARFKFIGIGKVSF